MELRESGLRSELVGTEEWVNENISYSDDEDASKKVPELITLQKFIIKILIIKIGFDI